ncbi:uncharacterized protein KY384_000724 [Bacidia gigantensis]|uniref:uncharacterized protein n=1 Tax=Bacidia gigantensis TaxID=2732470 RepID=UPI001D04FE2E|nr:uncharacterized protein KY384_000724 [Bacidia gigantensis]KAG8525962.1 hypothetical protein KY384_000724 [Bacidia gigantensis]
MQPVSVITIQLLLTYVVTTSLAVPLNLTESSTTLKTGFARCFDSHDAGRSIVRPNACKAIIAYLSYQPQFQEIKEYTDDNLPGPFGSQGCFVDIRVVRPRVSDLFSLALAGWVAEMINNRCLSERLEFNRGGFGLVGDRNKFIVDVYNSPPAEMPANWTEVPVEPITVL